MNTQTLILFIAFLLFSGFNFVLNIRSDRYLKVFTYILGIASLIGASYLLFIGFMNEI